MQSSHEANKHTSLEEDLPFCLPNDEWIEKYRATLITNAARGDRMTIRKRLAESSDRFSEMVLIALSNLLIQVQNAFRNLGASSPRGGIIPLNINSVRTAKVPTVQPQAELNSVIRRRVGGRWF
jgi:hypothetical protein